MTFYLTYFKVRLPIEIGCFNITHCLRFTEERKKKSSKVPSTNSQLRKPQPWKLCWPALQSGVITDRHENSDWWDRQDRQTGVWRAQRQDKAVSPMIYPHQPHKTAARLQVDRNNREWMGRGQACDGKQEVPAKTAQWAQVTLKVRGWPALDQNSRPGQARPAHTPSEGDYGQRNWEIKA